MRINTRVALYIFVLATLIVGSMGISYQAIHSQLENSKLETESSQLQLERRNSIDNTLNEIELYTGESGKEKTTVDNVNDFDASVSPQDQLVTGSRLSIDTAHNVLVIYMTQPYFDYLAALIAPYGLTVDPYFLGPVPSINQLTPYDVVYINIAQYILDPIGLGNVLADYVDAGGKLVVTAYVYVIPFAITGRLMSDGYFPFTAVTNDNLGIKVWDADASHEIFNGVMSYTASNAAIVDLDLGATVIGRYTGGLTLAAVKGSVIALNMFGGTPTNGGDVGLLLYNSIQFIGSLVAPAVNKVLIINDAQGHADGGAAELIPFGIQVDFFAAGTATITAIDLAPYSVVIVMSGNFYLDYVTTGNVLADWIDAGGSLIMVSWSYVGQFTIQGRLLTDGYYPITAIINNNLARTWDGVNSHSILDGVMSFTTSNSHNVDIQPGAAVLASYTDGIPMIAQKGSVLVWNFGLLSNTGDVGVIMYNSVQYMGAGTFPPPVDTTLPLVTSPADFSYFEGSTGNNISWSATDGEPSTYVITRDSVEVQSGIWYSGVAIVINIDGLSKGNYWYEIIVYDEFGNFASDLVNIDVVDLTLPTITSSSTLVTVVEGSTGNSISFTLNDNHPSTWQLIVDGVEVDSGYWTSGQVITISLDGLDIGIYHYVLFAHDESGNSGGFDVVVTVIDSTNPVINSPPDITYTEGTTGNQIVWIATDAHSGSYEVQVDGVVYALGNWNSEQSIFINVDGLSAGIYIFEIFVFDASDNDAIDQVIVTVNSSDEPTTSDESTTSDELTTSDEPTTSDESISTPPALPFPAGSIYLWLFSFLSVAVIVRRRH